MKLDSKYFDMIRIYRPAAEGKQDAKHGWPCCEWKGCTEPGRHRAPKGRGRDGQFYTFCFEHVRQYNTTYNYFDGMSEAEVEQFQKAAVYGHRPTWRVGNNAWSHGTHHGCSENDQNAFLHARSASGYAFTGWRARRRSDETPVYRRALKPLERRALEMLDLPESASRDEIKARFKMLVKRHHPDANGGHRGSEDRLREIIQSYNYLKQAGLV
jgi:hypothetical protein